MISAGSSHPVSVSGSFNSTLTARFIFTFVGGNCNYQVLK